MLSLGKLIGFKGVIRKEKFQRKGVPKKGCHTKRVFQRKGVIQKGYSKERVSYKKGVPKKGCSKERVKHLNHSQVLIHSFNVKDKLIMLTLKYNYLSQ